MDKRPCIIGASGSGKSSFVRSIIHMVVPYKGAVHIGTDISRPRTQRNGTPASQDPRLLERVRCRLGMVFQNFNLWSHRTAVQNITEGPVHVLRQPRAQAHQQALELLAKVGLEDKANAYPSELSGGQQQRVAIARALAMNPEVRSEERRV